MSQYDNYYQGITPGQETNNESAGRGGGGGGEEDEYVFAVNPSAGGGGSITQATIKNIKYDFGVLGSMHSAIDGVHRSNSIINNVSFQMSSPLNEYGYLPPPGTFEAIVANPTGDKKTLDRLKIDLRNSEISVHKRDKYGTIIFKNLINPDNNSDHENPNIPKTFMYYVPLLFKSVLFDDTNSNKLERTKFFIEELRKYKKHLLEWRPHDDQALNRHIDTIFDKIIIFVRDKKTQINMPKINVPNNNSKIQETFENFLKSLLDDLLGKFNDYNNVYVAGIYGGLRHKTVNGNNQIGLPRYIMEGNHVDEHEKYAGFSLIVYENTDLMTLWLEYCGKIGIKHKPDQEIIKTQDGAILRMDPPSPMYMFLRWCGNFLDDEVDAKSAFIVFLKMLSVDYSTFNKISEYGPVTTDELLYFIHLLKKIIAKHFAHDINKLNVYVYMFGCGNFDIEKEDELIYKFKNIVYDLTQPTEVEINTLSASQTGIKTIVDSVKNGTLQTSLDPLQIETIESLTQAINSEIKKTGSSQGSLSQEANGLTISQEDFNILSQLSQLSSANSVEGGGRKKRRKTRRNRRTRRGRKTR
jgi:hypothetical protein